MRKKILLTIIFIMVMTLFSCKKNITQECKHTFEEATYTQPKTCTKCGLTEGETLKNSSKEAISAQPIPNTECGETEGEKIEHAFKEATCTEPRTCTECGVTEGAALQHNYVLNAQGNYFCTICKKHIVDILGKNYFLNKFSEMDGYQYEKVNYCSFGGPRIPVLDNFARYKLLKEQAVFDEEKQVYLVPIIIEKAYALDKDKGDIEYVVQSAKPGNSGSKKVTLDELNSEYNIYVTISKANYEKLANIDTIISIASVKTEESERVGNDITETFHTKTSYLFEEDIDIEEPTIKLAIGLDNYSYIKDGKFYINNNEHLELIAKYYYQLLHDGMTVEEFDEWAFIAHYRRVMRLIDPTSLDLSK